MGKKKVVRGSLQLILILLALVFAISMCTDKEEANNNEWINTPNFEITDDMTLEEKAMYITLNTFKPDERLNMNDLPIIEKEMTLGSDVEVLDNNDGTKFLRMRIRHNNLSTNTEFPRINTVKIIKNITPFLIKNKITDIQFDWTYPQEWDNGAKVEPIYYILRFETPILEANLNSIDFKNIESYAAYVDVN